MVSSWICVDLGGMVRENFKSVSPEEMGWTQDEYNNFLIDCFTAMNKKSPATPHKYQYVDAITGEIVESSQPVVATITFSNYSKYSIR